MPPHHRAFTDSVEARQRMAHELVVAPTRKATGPQALAETDDDDDDRRTESVVTVSAASPSSAIPATWNDFGIESDSPVSDPSSISPARLPQPKTTTPIAEARPAANALATSSRRGPDPSLASRDEQNDSFQFFNPDQDLMQHDNAPAPIIGGFGPRVQALDPACARTSTAAAAACAVAGDRRLSPSDAPDDALDPSRRSTSTSTPTPTAPVTTDVISPLPSPRPSSLHIAAAASNMAALAPSLDSRSPENAAAEATTPIASSAAAAARIASKAPVPRAPRRASPTSHWSNMSRDRPTIRGHRSTSHDALAGHMLPLDSLAAAPFASTSRSAATLDPDHHWLSEDEARGGVDSRNRRLASASNSRGPDPGSRRRHGRSSDLDTIDGDAGDREGTEAPTIGDDRKAPRNLVNFNSTLPVSHHSIHQRPSTAPQTKSTQSMSPYSPEDPPLARLAPTLLSLVTCPACHRLYRDPTTLPCGHAVCLACSHPVMHRPADLPVLNALNTPASSESLFARNPTQPTLGPQQDHAFGSRPPVPMGRNPMMVDTGSSEGGLRSNVAGVYRGRLRCAHPDCKVSKDRLGPSSEAKVDFVLQKVLDILRTAFPRVDRQVELARLEVVDDEEALAADADVDDDVGAEPEATASVSTGLVDHGNFSRSPSGSSSSSIGGGEDPANQDDAKRQHRTKAWEASKRPRRPQPALAVAKELDIRTEIIARVELDYERVPPSFLADILSELECQICFQLLQDPVTSQCGHTFCQKCLARAYDHSDKCPLCRADFPTFIHFQSQPVNLTTQRVILSLFPSLAADRFAQLKAEERGLDGALDTPLFVCTLAWPNLPTYIHIFEPRYRLMIRRAMEANREFGMVLPSRDQGGINEYGTMLKIQSCNMIEDGRSIIETVGTYRFRVLEKGTLDGYTVGRIERVDDIPQEQEDELERRALARNLEPRQGGALSMSSGSRQLERSTAELMEICLEFVSTLRNGSAPWVLQRLNNTIGPMPTNPADFSFWMAEVMPVDDQNKALLLQVTSPRERLRLLVFWIEQFRSSWWFSRGCNLM